LFAVLGFELRTYTFSHFISPFFWWFFQDRVSQTICLAWLGTVILLISASWIARITGMSHQHLTDKRNLKSVITGVGWTSSSNKYINRSQQSHVGCDISLSIAFFKSPD
jgi:hypothetical protein